MTFEVQQTRWDRIIRRASGSIGPGSRVSETLSELFPVLDVERVPGELLLLGGTQVAMGASFTAAAVALIPGSMVRNPGGSGNLITITQVAIASGSVQRGVAGVTLNTFPTAGVQTIRDTRRGPAGKPVGQVLSDNALVPGPIFFRFLLDGVTTFVLKDDNGVAVLAPGTAFAVGGTTANTDLSVGWMWRERPAEESELSLE